MSGLAEKKLLQALADSDQIDIFSISGFLAGTL
jgi:hypothetical protein